MIFSNPDSEEGVGKVCVQETRRFEFYVFEFNDNLII